MHNKKRPGATPAADANFMRLVLSAATRHNGRKLEQDEVDGILQYARNVDYDRYTNKSREEIADSVGKTFVIRMRSSQGEEINVHEMLKRQIGTIPYDARSATIEDVEYAPYGTNSKFPGAPRGRPVPGTLGSAVTLEGFAGDDIKMPPRQAMAATAAAIPPAPKVLMDDATTVFSPALDKYPRIAKQNFQVATLFLDSKNRDLSTPPSVFRWGVMPGNSITQGTVNTLADQIHNIFKLQFDRTRIPYVPTADNGYRRISLGIDEFANASWMTYNRHQFHCFYEAELNAGFIELRPQHNDRGRFRFHTPVNILDQLTIRFFNPTEPVIFMPDRYNVVITALSATQSVLTFNEPHGVADGDVVEISEFTTGAPAADAVVIDQVNSPYGQTVAYLSDTTLGIGVDLTAAAILPTHISKAFITSRRVFIPLLVYYYT